MFSHDVWQSWNVIRASFISLTFLYDTRFLCKWFSALCILYPTCHFVKKKKKKELCSANIKNKSSLFPSIFLQIYGHLYYINHLLKPLASRPNVLSARCQCLILILQLCVILTHLDLSAVFQTFEYLSTFFTCKDFCTLYLFCIARIY